MRTHRNSNAEIPEQIPESETDVASQALLKTSPTNNRAITVSASAAESLTVKVTPASASAS